jgi:hypothetical protein
MKREDFLVEIEEEIDGTDITPKHKRPSGDKIALVKFDGTAITTNGNIVKHNWFKGLQLNQAKYSDIMLTAEEAQQLHAAQTQMRIGASSSTPMLCFPPGTLVNLSDGTLTPIERIKVGDSVTSHLGKSRRVDAILSRKYEGNIYRFHYGPNNSYYFPTAPATQEHPFFIKDKGWVAAKDIEIGDWLLSPFKSEDIDLTDEDLAVATLLGLYLAEGSLDLGKRGKEGWLEGDSTSFTLHKEETDLADMIIQACRTMGFRDPKLYSSKHSKAMVVRQNGKDLAQLMMRLGGRYSDAKVLANEVLLWPKRKLARMIYCYLLGDGHFRDYDIEKQKCSEISWATISQKLAHQLNTIMLAVGCTPSKRILRGWDYPTKRTAYHGRMPGWNLGVLLQKESTVPSYYKLDEHGLWSKIHSIQIDHYEGEVFNLEIEIDQSYCVEWIAVHNCYGAEVCPMASKCPFVALQREIDARGEGRLVVPIGRTCPVEQDLLFEWVARYAEEFGVTDAPGNFTDQRLLLELAECEVLENRMNVVLSTKFQDLTEDKVVAVMQDEYGEREQHVKDVSDAMRIKEKLEIKKDKIHKKLVATRFDQYKREAALQETNKNDSANLQAELTARLKKLEDLTKDR